MINKKKNSIQDYNEDTKLDRECRRFSSLTEDLLIQMHRSIDSFNCLTSRGVHINFFVVLSSANCGAQVKQTGPVPDVYQLKAPWCLIM